MVHVRNTYFEGAKIIKLFNRYNKIFLEIYMIILTLLLFRLVSSVIFCKNHEAFVYFLIVPHPRPFRSDLNITGQRVLGKL
jgi:hypothetical protein